MRLHLDITLGWLDLAWVFPLAAFLMWVGYLALTNLERTRVERGLTDPQRLGAGILLAIFGPLDVALNWTFCVLLFLELPREATVSKRCMRHFMADGWRGDVARWLGRHALDPFDHRGAHINADIITAYYERRRHA